MRHFSLRNERNEYDITFTWRYFAQAVKLDLVSILNGAENNYHSALHQTPLSSLASRAVAEISEIQLIKTGQQFYWISTTTLDVWYLHRKYLFRRP
jgi:hypothetical protein